MSYFKDTLGRPASINGNFEGFLPAFEVIQRVIRREHLTPAEDAVFLFSDQKGCFFSTHGSSENTILSRYKLISTVHLRALQNINTVEDLKTKIQTLVGEDRVVLETVDQLVQHLNDRLKH